MNRRTGLENRPVLLPFLCESNSLQITQLIMCILFVAVFFLIESRAIALWSKASICHSTGWLICEFDNFAIEKPFPLSSVKIGKCRISKLFGTKWSYLWTINWILFCTRFHLSAQLPKIMEGPQIYYAFISGGRGFSDKIFSAESNQNHRYNVRKEFA